MEDVLERAQSLIAGYDEELTRELPENVEIFDAHVHLGHDIDGMTGVYEDLDRINERYGISRCFMPAKARIASTRSSATSAARRPILRIRLRRCSRSARRSGLTGVSCRSPTCIGCRPRTTATWSRSSPGN